MNLPDCPVEITLMLIGDKWKIFILRELMGGTKRFGGLKKSIGHISQKVLTSQLRDMEEKGLLTRTVYAEVPPRVEYTLTETGYSLNSVLEAMRIWGTAYRQSMERSACEESHPAAGMDPSAEDGASSAPPIRLPQLPMPPSSP